MFPPPWVHSPWCPKSLWYRTLPLFSFHFISFKKNCLARINGTHNSQCIKTNFSVLRQFNKKQKKKDKTNKQTNKTITATTKKRKERRFSSMCMLRRGAYARGNIGWRGPYRVPQPVPKGWVLVFRVKWYVKVGDNTALDYWPLNWPLWPLRTGKLQEQVTVGTTSLPP